MTPRFDVVVDSLRHLVINILSLFCRSLMYFLMGKTFIEYRMMYSMVYFQEYDQG